MVFTRYVEVGRVALVNFGPDSGKIATIVDVVDQNKCLIDGPTTGVARQIIPYKRLALTDIKVEVGRGAKAAALKKAWTTAGAQEKWDGSSWAKKLSSKKTRKGLSDFQRFKVMVARKQKSQAVKKEMKKLKA
ncbi:hypothetical protein TrRE_jg10230 [Triparma retinervis]|uniref:Large ribosomal subunit protein eL14 domain-containing protein n=1 Tax=Triparma retinervis TaxID=2557542 RepID=A0A9W6ZJH1_9STRA|nr:hypothetical protein TrRE_jg10230 [Triparma retinervis]